jgi:hypothetical protein
MLTSSSGSEELLAKKTDKLDITVERALGELSKLASANMTRISRGG